jgi:predicted alpha/beta superfamily hydrolase
MSQDLYRTGQILSRTLRVYYPAGDGRIMLRTEYDWDRPIEADRRAGDCFEFDLRAQKPFVYFKPCLVSGPETRWASGPNFLVLMTTPEPRLVYPFFSGEEHGSITPVIELESQILDRKHLLRVYLPPGYGENPAKRYPVLYMQDGKNLFFPEEAFLNREWMVDESLATLDQMNAADKCLVVGIFSCDRMAEYTQPGYELYGRGVVEEIKPYIDANFRTLSSPQETGVMGSSLGGVVSFYLGWQYPEVFGYAACLSSTFSHKDDLIDRVLAEPKRSTRFYLDSGWPGDNYEVTLAMAMALEHRGHCYGSSFVHFAFPLAEHDEKAWGERLHLPIQMFSGKISTAARGRFV